MDSLSLITILDQAFGSENGPLNVSDGCPRDICVRIEQEYHNKPRDQLTSKDIFFLSQNLILLNPDAFRYYCLPILKAAITNPKTVEMDDLIQNFIYFPGMNDYKNYTKKRLDLFSKAESAAILILLKLWLENPKVADIWGENIEKSLSYWKKKV